MTTYVAHDCRNSRRATTLIPTWKYCRECCEKLGIDFEKQKPSDYMSEEEIQKRKINLEKGRKSKHLI